MHLRHFHGSGARAKRVLRDLNHTFEGYVRIDAGEGRRRAQLRCAGYSRGTMRLDQQRVLPLLARAPFHPGQEGSDTAAAAQPLGGEAATAGGTSATAGCSNNVIDGAGLVGSGSSRVAKFERRCSEMSSMRV